MATTIFHFMQHRQHKTLDQFYDHLEYKEQFRPYTIRGYKTVLNKIFRDLGTLKVKPKQAENWMLNMQKKKYSASHINNTSNILERYLRFGGKKVSKKAGISKRVYPHLFRHSLASNLIKKGANIITVQNQLRHEKIDTTMIYIRSFPERIKDEYQYFVPNYI